MTYPIYGSIFRRSTCHPEALSLSAPEGLNRRRVCRNGVLVAQAFRPERFALGKHSAVGAAPFSRHFPFSAFRFLLPKENRHEQYARAGRRQGSPQTLSGRLGGRDRPVGRGPDPFRADPAHPLVTPLTFLVAPARPEPRKTSGRPPEPRVRAQHRRAPSRQAPNPTQLFARLCSRGFTPPPAQNPRLKT